MSDERADTTRTLQSAARAYYRALDSDDYELLADLLDAEFVHERPDMTLESRERFVRFMREERPMKDTSHPIDGVYTQENGDEVVVRGRLLDSEGEQITQFADIFSFDGENIVRIRTFVD